MVSQFPKSITSMTLGLLAGAAMFTAVLPAAQAAEPYKLGMQDRLRVNVYEWPAVTGEVTVGANGTVTLPLVGEIKADGLTPTELAHAIAQSLQTKARMSDLPDTSVDILEYRPFYILGGVERPGEYPFRPGMVVLNAVTIAGGSYRRPGESGWATQRDAIESQADAQGFSVRVDELTARAFRLQAEAQGRDAFPTPPADLKISEAHLAEERSVFDNRRQRIENESQSLLNGVGLYENEIDSLAKQKEAEDRERAVVQRELDKTKDLVNRGLTTAPNVMPLERALAQIDREAQELETQSLRAQQQINAAHQEIGRLRDQFASEAATQLQTVQDELRSIAPRQQAALQILTESDSFVAENALTEGSDAMDGLVYAIVRTTDGQKVEMAADETTPLLPGDIVKVRKRAPNVGTPNTTSAIEPTRPLSLAETAGQDLTR